MESAFSQNDETTVSELLKQNTNLCNAAIWWSRRPLQVAIEKGWDETVDLLLKNGANPNMEGDIWSTSNAGLTPMDVAIQFNRLHIFKQLLEAGADLNHRSTFHGPALNEAFKYHRGEMVILLLDNGANPFLEDLSYWKRTPIELAISQSDGKLVSKMLKSVRVKKEIRAKFLAEHGSALLADAAQRGELEAVEALLAAGVQVPTAKTNTLTLLQSVSRAFADVKNSKGFLPERWGQIHELLQKSGAHDDAFSATGFGDLESARNFFKANANVVQSKDAEGQSLLHWSVLTDQLPFTDFWLESGVARAATNAAGQTPLHLAAARGLTKQVTRLLAAGVPLDLKDTNGMTAFEVAVQAKQTEVIQLLLAKNPANAISQYGISTPLHKAAADGKIEALTNVLATVTNLEMPDELGFTPFQIAVKRGHLQAATLLLEAGADVNARDAKGNTALQLIMLEPPNWIADRPPISWYARIHQDEQMKYLFPYLLGNDEGQHSSAFECAVFLLANKAAAGGTNVGGQSVFDLATSESARIFPDDRAQLLEILGKRGGVTGADIDGRDAEGNTALHRAAHEPGDFSGKVAQLIAAGANVNATNFEGRTPLHLAVEKIGSWPYNGGQDSTVMALLKSGANPNAQDTNGLTPLDILATADTSFRKEATLALLQSGANPNLRDQQGRTAAHLFLTGKWPWNEAAECIVMLIKSGADLSVKDNDGKAPLHYLAALGDGNQDPMFFIRNIGDTFVAAKVDFEARDKAGNTPLYFAAKTGSKDVYDWLVKNGASLDATNNAGETPRQMAMVSTNPFSRFRFDADLDIFQAIRGGKLESVQAILKSSPELLNRTNQFGENPLRTAVLSKRTNIMEFLAQRGAQWDQISATAANRGAELRKILTQSPSAATNSSLLQLAAANDADIAAEILITSGADLKAQDVWGLSPLGNALLRHKNNVAAVFAKHKATKNIFDAVYLDDLPVVASLLADNRSLAQAVNKSGTTLPEIAAVVGDEKMIKLVLDNGASLSSTNGTTALHIAAIYNQTNVVEYLINSGANIEAFDRQGFAPLHLAVLHDSEATAVLLLKKRFLKHKVNPDIQTIAVNTPNRPMSPMMSPFASGAGNTALHFAASTAETNMIQLLLQAGASVNATNAAGMTPLDFASRQRFGGPPISFWLRHAYIFGPPDVFPSVHQSPPVFPPTQTATVNLLEKAGAKHGERFQQNGMPGMMRGGSF
ncbi:MAG: ankyrin repeat domain-containing protein [Verrucomicrobiae bacterium]